MMMVDVYKDKYIHNYLPTAAVAVVVVVAVIERMQFGAISSVLYMRRDIHPLFAIPFQRFHKA